MGTVLAGSLITQANILLNDLAGIRWPEAEMLDWLNAGQGEVVLLKPTSNTKTVAVQLVAGTAQQIPADGILLLRVKRNMGAGGTTPGAVITPVDEGLLNAIDPDWHSTSASMTVIHSLFDENTPKQFYVYPPQPDPGGYVELNYSASPVAVSSVSDPISLDDIYQNLLVDYMVFRALSKDSDAQLSDNRAATSYQRFVAALGVKSSAESALAGKG